MTAAQDQRPDMPVYGDPPVRVIAPIVPVHGRRLVLLPMKAPIGPSRGRRYRITDDHGQARIRVVLAVSDRAALRVPTALPPHTRSITLTIEALRPTRRRRLPTDLSQALTSAGADPTSLTAAELDQLLQMVGESSSATIRSARIHAAVAAVLASGGGDA